MPKGIVTTDAGKKYRLVAREEAGLVPCPGEAHSNPFIDNCGICAPRWGEAMSYKPTPLSALTEGVAVPFDYTHRCGELDSENGKAFEAAEAAGKIKLVSVREKTPAVTRYFSAYVLA